MKLVLGNIAEMETDAIATSAHTDLKPSPGISEAIFSAADRKELMKICKKLSPCPIGQAVITPSCGLKCKYIIHVAGSGWYNGTKAERLVFAGCYTRVLYKAYAHSCRSIAIPLMFSGEYHLPRAQALEIVCRVVKEFESVHPDMDIYLVLYTKSILSMAQKIYDRVYPEKN